MNFLMFESTGLADGSGVDGTELHTLAALSLGDRVSTHYRIDEDGCLLFLDCSEPGTETGSAIPFPTGLDARATTDMALLWLSRATYVTLPPHDGIVAKGYRVTRRKVMTDHTCMLSVEPVWVRVASQSA